MAYASQVLDAVRGASPVNRGVSKWGSVASANDLNLTGKKGSYYKVTGTTTINGIKKDGIVAGSEIFLEFAGICTITHNGSPSTGYSKIYLTAAANANTAATTIIHLVYDGSVWREAGVSTATYTGGVTPGTVTASKAVVVDANKDISTFRNLTATNFDAGSSGVAGTLDVFPTTASKGKLSIAAADSAGDTTTTITNASQGGARTYTIPDAGASAKFSMLQGTYGLQGEAASYGVISNRKTGIANNTATDMFTVTVPNGEVACAIRLTILGHLGTGTDIFESARCAEGMVVVSRKTGVNAAAAAATLGLTAIATTSGGGTLTLAYGVSSISGAVGATNTFTIQVTLVVTGTITDHQCMIVAEIINSAATGATIATA